MREVKFRFWYKEDNLYQDMDDMAVALSEGWPNMFEDDNFIPEQYTGVKDKNGKEIYEGDIMISDHTKLQDIKYKVRWEGGGFVINTSVSKWQNDKFPYEAIADLQTKSFIRSSCEVIGNIHENPELLK